MKKNSLWSSYADFKEFNKLDGDKETDVLIIGGGLTGISTAFNLIGKNLDVILVERNRVGQSVSSRTTGKITYLQENIYSKLKMNINENVSKCYYDSQKYAIKLLINIITENKIECDLEKNSSYIWTDKENSIKKIVLEKKLLTKFGSKVFSTDNIPDNTKCKYAISVDDSYVFNPIKYINGLKRICEKNDIDIYENTKIDSITKVGDYYICKTAECMVKAKYVVLALHYPYFLFPFLMPLKAKLEKSYIRAFRVDKYYDFNAINIDKPTKSIRYYKDGDSMYKIELTASHNICVRNDEKSNFKEIDNMSNNKALYEWSNIDIISNDNLPFIGAIADNLLIGTGFNTWGMTNGVLSGSILSDIILKSKNKYTQLFNPKRGINFGKIKSFPIILSSNIYSFVKNKIFLNKSWYSDNIKFSTINGKRVGIVTDKNNKEHIVYTKCPHIGCNLIYNEIEKTWDCPCHGSRFSIDGKCILGPSNYDISVKKDI